MLTYDLLKVKSQTSKKTMSVASFRQFSTSNPIKLYRACSLRSKGKGKHAFHLDVERVVKGYQRMGMNHVPKLMQPAPQHMKHAENPKGNGLSMFGQGEVSALSDCHWFAKSIRATSIPHGLTIIADSSDRPNHRIITPSDDLSFDAYRNRMASFGEDEWHYLMSIRSTDAVTEFVHNHDLRGKKWHELNNIEMGSMLSTLLTALHHSSKDPLFFLIDTYRTKANWCHLPLEFDMQSSVQALCAFVSCVLAEENGLELLLYIAQKNPEIFDEQAVRRYIAQCDGSGPNGSYIPGGGKRSYSTAPTPYDDQATFFRMIGAFRRFGILFSMETNYISNYISNKYGNLLINLPDSFPCDLVSDMTERVFARPLPPILDSRCLWFTFAYRARERRLVTLLHELALEPHDPRVIVLSSELDRVFYKLWRMYNDHVHSMDVPHIENKHLECTDIGSQPIELLEQHGQIFDEFLCNDYSVWGKEFYHLFMKLSVFKHLVQNVLGDGMSSYCIDESLNFKLNQQDYQFIIDGQGSMLSDLDGIKRLFHLYRMELKPRHVELVEEMIDEINDLEWIGDLCRRMCVESM
eukprot:112047_1